VDDLLRLVLLDGRGAANSMNAPGGRFRHGA
jgi:hypothetical protein